jgi:hypothetical protein
MRVGTAVDSITYNENGTLTVTTTPCGFCGNPGEVSVPEDEFFAWADDMVLIQDAMPNIAKERREQLKSGTCPDCWEKYFGLPADGETVA